MARRIAVMGAIVAVICLLFWAGWVNLRGRRATMQAAQKSTMTLSGGGDTAPAETHLRGKLAPGFSLLDVNGRKVSLADFKGRPVVVNFWATWCGPCKLEMPWFQEFHTKYKAEGLEVLGISEDEGGPRDEILKAAHDSGVTYPILLTDGAVAKAYGGVDYLPETFYVDRDGSVVEETAGAPSKGEMETLIRKTIAAGGLAGPGGQ